MDTTDLTRMLLNAEGGSTIHFGSPQRIKEDRRDKELPTPGILEKAERMAKLVKTNNTKTTPNGEIIITDSAKVSTTQPAAKKSTRGSKTKKKANGAG